MNGYNQIFFRSASKLTPESKLNFIEKSNLYLLLTPVAFLFISKHDYIVLTQYILLTRRQCRNSSSYCKILRKKFFTLSMCIKIGNRVNTLLWEKFKFKHISTFYRICVYLLNIRCNLSFRRQCCLYIWRTLE